MSGACCLSRSSLLFALALWRLKFWENVQYILWQSEVNTQFINLIKSICSTISCKFFIQPTVHLKKFVSLSKKVKTNSWGWEDDERLSRSSRVEVEGENSYSRQLVVTSSKAAQSGQYHCAANPGQSNSVTVHVHRGKATTSMEISIPFHSEQTNMMQVLQGCGDGWSTQCSRYQMKWIVRYKIIQMECRTSEQSSCFKSNERKRNSEWEWWVWTQLQVILRSRVQIAPFNCLWNPSCDHSLILWRTLSPGVSLPSLIVSLSNVSLCYTVGLSTLQGSSY